MLHQTLSHLVVSVKNIERGKEQTNNQHRQQVINNYSRSKSVSFKSHFSSNPVIKNDPKVYHADTTTLNNFPLFYH
jgi:hypothetical protein